MGLAQLDQPPKATGVAQESGTGVPDPGRSWAYRLATSALLRTVLPLAILLAWWVVTDGVHLVPPLLLPSPISVLEASLRLASTGELWDAIGSSVRRVLTGFAIAVVAGVLLGSLGGLSRSVEQALEPVVALVRPIPPIAWIPLAILWFGLGDRSAFFVVAYAAFFPIFLNVVAGIMGVERQLLNAATTLGAGRQYLLRHVILPASIPQIFIGMRTGFGISWMAIVAAELIGAQSGLGYMIEYYRRLLSPAEVITGMITIGILGYLFDTLLQRLQERAVPWYVATRGARHT